MSGRRDNLDECTFNWVQQRLVVWLSALDREGSVIMGKSLKLLVYFSSPASVSPLLCCFQSPSPLPNSLRHVDF